ncbi:O-antigen polysaccharide polymerase Wzy [Vibrio sp. OPT10]|uniref:O-antigen polysaccharide polymerase Wzy n=1 Tax=Vibrio sp. OPT10 TaxID=2778640 RepID=UPI00187F5D84|nr:O-antigen polysaccharide polymerase Wzy [Vibrio sp. OPT10]MBE8607849.1 O-antigen polysaccharide polymerase Wzy [Vibrio sp. OPT10]
MKIFYQDAIVFFVLVVLFLIFYFGGGEGQSFGQFLLLFGILFQSNLMYRYRYNDVVFIFLFFSLLYPLYLTAYYFFDIPYHYLTEYQTYENTTFVFLCHFTFINVMFFSLEAEESNHLRFKIKKRENKLVFYTLLAFLIVMLPIAVVISPPSIGASYTGEVQSSIWLEYCLVFIIIAGCYSSTLTQEKSLKLVSFIYMLLPLLYGRRLQFIMVSLATFILFYSGRIKTKYILMLAIFGFLSLRIFASVRMDVSMSFVNSIMSIDEDGIMGNNQGGVVVSAVTYYELIKQDIFDFKFRLLSLVGTFTSIFLPYSLNIKEAYINFEALKHIPIPGNGGLPGVYLYLWGGIPGIILGAYLLNRLLKNVSNSRIIAIYVVFMMSTFPRWHSYNMFILVKMGFWLVLILTVIDFFNKRMKGKTL